jgi:hypothetical protein
MIQHLSSALQYHRFFGWQYRDIKLWRKAALIIYRLSIQHAGKFKRCRRNSLGTFAYVYTKFASGGLHLSLAAQACEVRGVVWFRVDKRDLSSSHHAGIKPLNMTLKHKRTTNATYPSC